MLSQLLVHNNEPTNEEILKTNIDKGGKIPIHIALWINYTIYDPQRCPDSRGVQMSSTFTHNLIS